MNMQEKDKIKLDYDRITVRPLTPKKERKKMKTNKNPNRKTNISSLNAETKKKIKELAKRSKQIQKGVSKNVLITPKTIKFKVEVRWDEGDSCFLPHFDEDDSRLYMQFNKTIRDAHLDFQKEINKEIKTIIAFSDKIADKLGVDKTEFFDQYFLY